MDSVPVTEIQWNSILWLSSAQITIVRLHLKRSHHKIKCSFLLHYPFSPQFSILMILGLNYLSRRGRINIITEPASIHRHWRIWFTGTSTATRKVQTESTPEDQRPTTLASTQDWIQGWKQTGNTLHVSQWLENHSPGHSPRNALASPSVEVLQTPAEPSLGNFFDRRSGGTVTHSGTSPHRDSGKGNDTESG